MGRPALNLNLTKCSVRKFNNVKRAGILQILAHVVLVAGGAHTAIRHVEVTAPGFQTEVVNHLAALAALENLHAADATLLGVKQLLVQLGFDALTVGTLYHLAVALVVNIFVVGLLCFGIHQLHLVQHLRHLVRHFVSLAFLCCEYIIARQFGFVNPNSGDLTILTNQIFC